MDLHHPDRNEIELAAVLHALSDPHRLEIVRRLAEDAEPRPCGTFELRPQQVDDDPSLADPARGGSDPAGAAGTTKLTWLRREDLDARFPGLLEAVLSASAVSA